MVQLGERVLCAQPGDGEKVGGGLWPLIGRVSELDTFQRLLDTAVRPD